MCPQILTLTLDSSNTEDTLTCVEMSDLVLYLDHDDPGLRGGVAKLALSELELEGPPPHSLLFLLLGVVD